MLYVYPTNMQSCRTDPWTRIDVTRCRSWFCGKDGPLVFPFLCQLRPTRVQSKVQHWPTQLSQKGSNKKRKISKINQSINQSINQAIKQASKQASKQAWKVGKKNKFWSQMAEHLTMCYWSCHLLNHNPKRCKRNLTKPRKLNRKSARAKGWRRCG